MILPDRDFGTAEEDVLSGSGFGVFFLDLNLAYHAGMLDNLGDIGLVFSTDFSCDSLHEVYVSSIHPVLPENSNGS